MSATLINVDFNEMIKRSLDELKEVCQFCLTKSSASKLWNTDQFLQIEIPRLYEIVTALKVYAMKCIFVFSIIQLFFMHAYTVGILIPPFTKPRMLSM